MDLYTLKGINRRLWDQSGFSLLETILAVFLISTIGIGVIRAIDTNARAAQNLDDQVQATNIVTAYLENMRQLSYNDSSLNPYPTIGNNVTVSQYIVTVSVLYGNSPDGVNITYSTTNNSGAYTLQKIPYPFHAGTENLS